jgi:hypothetical protein
MPTPRLLRQLTLITACLALPGAALADVVLISPLIAQRGVDEDQVADLFTLMTSELEFMANVDEVIELPELPSMLDLACLDSTRCLGDISRRAEADTMLTGAVSTSGGDLVLDLLFYDARINRVVRRNSFTVPADASAIINGITPILVEIVTGVTQASQAEEDGGLPDLSFREGEDDEEDDAPPARSVGTPIVAPPAPADPEPEPEFDPSAISFGGSASDITFGGSPADISYTPTPITPPPEPEPRTAPPPTRPAPDFDEEEEEEEEPRPAPSRAPVDLDEDDDRGRASTSSSVRSSTTRKTDPRKEYRRFHLNLRGGYKNYGIFNFGELQIEAQVRLASGLFLSAGVDGSFVQRELPPGTPIEVNGVQRRACITPPRATVDGRIIELNCIWPMHAGLLYKFKAGIAQPYIGVDAVFSQYFQDPTTGKQSWASGARGRLGTDVFFSRYVGLNFDLAIGFWSGKNWGLVDPRLKTTGFLPTFGGGLVFAF